MNSRDARIYTGTLLLSSKQRVSVGDMSMRFATVAAELPWRTAIDTVGTTSVPERELLLSLSALGCFLRLADELWDHNGDASLGWLETPSFRGHLPSLKRAGLVATHVRSDGSMRGRSTYIRLTPGGYALAAAYGIEVPVPKDKSRETLSPSSIPSGWKSVSLKKY